MMNLLLHVLPLGRSRSAPAQLVLTPVKASVEPTLASTVIPLLLGFAVALLICIYTPEYIVRLRMFLFTRVNGEDGIQFPNEKLGVEGQAFKRLYSHKSARLRSRQHGVGLSDLFWYFLSPGAHIHQEHVETADPRYALVSGLTRKLCAMPEAKLAALGTKYAEQLLSEENVGAWSLTRLRLFWFPAFSRLFFEVVFEEECPADVVEMLVDSGNDVISALKCTKERDMAMRGRLTSYIHELIERGKAAHLGLDPSIPDIEWALFIQGVFFHTACVQMSEAMSHCSLVLAQHPECHAKLLAAMHDDATRAAESSTSPHTPGYLKLFVTEVLRLYPLFGIAHRITSEPITTESGHTLPEGSVLCFNYPKFHASGYKRPADFWPERWETLKPSSANYIPFGVPANRPCPGQQMALVLMRAMLKVTVERATFQTPIAHSRSLPCGGFCIVMSRSATPPAKLTLVAITSFMKLRETVDNFTRSMRQLVYATRMLLHSRELRLAQRYFEHDDASRFRHIHGVDM
jgi:hypothetical protein